MKKSFVSKAGVLFFVLILSLTATNVVGHAQQLQKIDRVTFEMDWVIFGRFAPFFVALDKGYYIDNGIECRIFRGYGGIKTVASIDQKAATFGIADIAPLIITRSKGGHVKMIGMYHDLNPIGFAALKGRGITNPKAMEGKSLAMAAFDATRAILPVLAKVNGVDLNKIKIVTLDPAVKTQAVIRGDVDMEVAWKSSNYEIVLDQVRKAGKDYDWFGIKDFGLDIYSAGIIVHDDLIKQNPDLVRRFTAATYKGIKYSVDNPEEAAEILLKYEPALPPETTKAAFLAAKEMLLSKTAQEKGLGWITEEKMKRTRDIILEAYEIKVEMPLNDIYTNEFLPQYKK